MSKIPPPTDPIEVLGEAYELLLEKLLDEFHVRDPHHRDKAGEVDELIEQASHKTPVLQDLNKAAQEHVRQAVERDLQSLNRYQHAGQQGAEGWLGFELHQLEGRLKALISKAADPSVTDWLEWKSETERLPYHTGGITGPGILVCDTCGEQLHFKKPGRIPPCPKCGGTHFHRLSEQNG